MLIKCLMLLTSGNQDFWGWQKFKKITLLTQVIFNLQFIGDKVVETLHSNRVTSENKRIHTPPPPLHSKLECLWFSIGSLNSGTTLHGGDGGGKALFSPFEVIKISKSPILAKCLNWFCRCRLVTSFFGLLALILLFMKEIENQCRLKNLPEFNFDL